MRVDYAKLLALMERYRDAAEESRKALKVEPARFAALIVLADASLAAGRELRPMAVARSLATEFPENPAGPFLIGRAHHRTGEAAEALAHYRRAFEKERGSLIVLDALAGCSLALKKPKQAIAFCRDFIKDNPTSVPAHELLGRIYLGQGLHDEAERAFQQAARLNPVSLDPVLALLQVYRQQNKDQLALKTCQDYVRRWRARSNSSPCRSTAGQGRMSHCRMGSPKQRVPTPS